MSTLLSDPKVPHRPWRGVDAADRVTVRREKLLAAGLAVFAREGYAGAKVQTICLEAGLTQRYFYESFASKEELLGALVERIASDGLAAIAEALAVTERPVPELARDGLKALIDNLVTDPRRGSVLLVESVGVSAEIEALRRAHFAQLSELTREVGIAALAEAAPPRLDADLTARAMVGSTIELLVALVRGEISISTDRVAAHLVLMFEATAPIVSEDER